MKLPASINRVLNIGDAFTAYLQTKADFRDWLHGLGNLSTSLSSQEKELLKAVFKEAKRQVFKEIKRKKSNDKMPTRDNVDDISHKVTVVTECLQTITQKFDMCKEAEVKFVRAYPTWKKQRSANIKSMKETGESLQRDREMCNISTLFGDIMSLTGGVFLAALPLTGGLTAPAAYACSAAVALGSGISIGTSITEKTLLKNKVTKAKEIVKEDILSFGDLLMGEISVHETLNDVLSIVVDISIGKNPEIIAKFAILVDEMSKSASKNTPIKKFVKFALENLLPQFHLMTIFPRLLGLLVILVLKCSINQTAFRFACITWEIIENNIVPIASASLYLMQSAVTSVFTAGSMNAQKVVGSSLTAGFLAGIGISLSVTRIVLTAIDIKTGSESEEAQKILKAAEKMEKEAYVLEKVYTELKMKEKADVL